MEFVQEMKQSVLSKDEVKDRAWLFTRHNNHILTMTDSTFLSLFVASDMNIVCVGLSVNISVRCENLVFA